jgi:hypothetical protein
MAARRRRAAKLGGERLGRQWQRGGDVTIITHALENGELRV